MLTKQLLLFSIIAALGACGADDDESKPKENAKNEDAAAEAAADDAGSDQPAAKAVEVIDCAGVTADKTDKEVSMEAIAFMPAELTISAGQVVKWTNKDTLAHTVTSGRASDADGGDLFDSGNLNKDDTYCLRFNDKGTYNYWCRPHPTQMNNGIVIVQ